MVSSTGDDPPHRPTRWNPWRPSPGRWPPGTGPRSTADPGLADRLTPIAETHTAHADELRRLIGRPEPSGPAASAAPTTAPAPIRTPSDRAAGAEKSGRDSAANAACADAPRERAALLGSIAAARATHLEALK